FVSSRRRHTRSKRDWSSDVCSSDLRTKLHLANAIYVNEGTQVNDSCLNTLASDYYCYSYAADFAGDNRAANEAVKNFVSEQTDEIGRASCRERVEKWGHAATFTTKR